MKKLPDEVSGLLRVEPTMHTLLQPHSQRLLKQCAMIDPYVPAGDSHERSVALNHAILSVKLDNPTRYKLEF